MIAGEWEEPRSLLDWLDSPRSDRGLRFLDEGWVRYSYADLAELVLGASNALRARETVTGDVVAVTAAEPLRFVTGFFGALHAGATPLPVAPPILLGARYIEHVASLIAAAPPRVIVSTPETDPDIQAAIERAGVTAEVIVEYPRSGAADRADPAPLALLQFTSGSTGQPKPVEVSWTSLDANTSLIRRWLELTTDDSVASWLPLYHDMGLIGTLLTAVVSEMDAWIMRPEQFVLRPRQWLECFGLHGVTIASSPNFGYSYTERRVRPEAIEDFDFSRWRVAIIGAERLDPAALRRFLSLAQPFGFRPDSFRPAYGLAEATLAVTGHPLGSTPDCITVDWHGLRFDAPVSVESRHPLDRSDAFDSPSVLVSCGRALHGQQVSIVDSEGRPLAPGWLGEILVEGPCVATGYRARADGAATRLDQGRLLTGDAGFMLDEELFVLGRIVDSFKVHGRQVYAESVEAKLAGLVNLPVDKCVVVPAQGADRDQVVAVIESVGTDWSDQVVKLLRAEVGNSLDVVVYAARRNAIPRTTSGKPRRRVLRQLLLADELDADLVFSSALHPTADAAAGGTVVLSLTGDASSPSVWRHLSSLPEKQAFYEVDPYFRECWHDASRVLGERLLPRLQQLALVAIKPEAFAGRRGGTILTFMLDHAFTPVLVHVVEPDRLAIRELWRFQWNSATVERIDVASRINTMAPLLLVILRNDHVPSTLPATVRLKDLKGVARVEDRRPGSLRTMLRSPNRLLTFLHCADEPADIVRELGILFDRPTRQRILGRLVAAGSLDATTACRSQLATLEAAVPEHDLDAAAAWSRLVQQADPANAAALSEEYRSYRQTGQLDWGRLAELAAGSGADGWDVLAVAADAVDDEVPGRRPLISFSEAGIAGWLNGSADLYPS